MSTTDYMRRKRFINALVADTKLNYEEKKGAVPHTRGDTIIMPQYDSSFSDEQDVAWMEALITQCYANMPDNKDDVRQIVSQNIDMDSEYGYVYNTVCKHNQQKKRDGVLFGADEYVLKAQQQRLLGIDRDELSPKAKALLAFDVASRSEWQLGTDYGFVSSLEGEAKELFDQLMTLQDEYNSVRESGSENVELANKISKILECENENQPEQSEGNGESGEGDAGKNPQEGKEGQADKDGKESNPSKEEGEGNEEGSVKPKKGQYGDSSINGVPSGPLEIEHYDTEEQLVPMPTKVVVPNPEQESPHVHKQFIHDNCTSTLSTKVRNILKVYSQAKYKGGKKRGKINKRAIASIVTGNDAIFRKKELADVLDTAVMILVDSSGSMHGSKYVHASAACTMLVECLQKLNIPTAAYGFTYYYAGENILYQHKTFSQRKERGDIIDSLGGGDMALQGNSDAEALLYCYDILMQQKQKRKIMIVLSDGEPADGANPHTFLVKVCKDIEQERRCELYGIGIETSCVKRYYTNNAVINSSSQLEDTLLNLIKSALT